MLEVIEVSKRYGAREVIERLTLSVAPGEIMTLLGPSGCGKSTLLNLIAGLDTPDSGILRFRGADLKRVPPEARQFALMFQDYALFPHLKVLDNVLFGLVERRVPRAPARIRALKALDALGMSSLAQRHVGTLSGGEAQRVALARALVVEPRLILLDEPFSSMDAHWRQALQSEFKRRLKSLGISALWVTHDRQEAFAMADRVALLHQGHIQQCAAPEQLLAAPANPWVARFIGFENVGENAVVPDAAFILAPGQPPAQIEAVMIQAEGVRLRVRTESDIYSLHLSSREASQLGEQLRPGGTIGLGVDRRALIHFHHP